MGVRREECRRRARAVESIAERRRSSVGCYYSQLPSKFFIILYTVIPQHIAPSRSFENNNCRVSFIIVVPILRGVAFYL